MNQFFIIYEYNDEDKEIFHELLKLAKDDDGPCLEIRVYEYVFQRAYKIDPPQYAYQMVCFDLSLKSMFSQTFVPGLVKTLADLEQ